MEITKNIHLLQATKGSYAYLVLGDEPILIDTCLPGVVIRPQRIFHYQSQLFTISGEE